MPDKYIIQRRTASGLENVAELPALENGKIDLSWLPIVGAMGSAIIERGSNANGEYVRWADGTQVCYSTVKTHNNLSSTGINTHGFARYRIPMTYPAAFISVPAIATCGGQNQENYGWSEAETVGSTSFNLCVWAYDFTTLTVAVLGYLAIGRWK